MGAVQTISRRVQWMDTDAGGIWHYSTVIRWAEEAEAELHRRLGIIGDTFGLTPRVRVGFEFREQLHFDDPVDVTIEVVRIGRSSIEYGVTVRHRDAVVATGRVFNVLVERNTGRPRAWPDPMRTVLA